MVDIKQVYVARSHFDIYYAAMGKSIQLSYPLRMPPELRQELENAAKNTGRSLNAEILVRLQQSLETSEGRKPTLKDILERLEQLENLIKQRHSS